MLFCGIFFSVSILNKGKEIDCFTHTEKKHTQKTDEQEFDKV